MPDLLTIYQGRSADRSTHGMAGAAALGDAIARHLGVSPTIVGSAAHSPATRWDRDLREAGADLRALATDLDGRLHAGTRPLTVLTRCAAAVATLPVVMRHRPETCVVWFDAHADLNTPDTSPSGYLGGMVLAATAGLWDSGLGAGVSLPHVVLVGVRDVDPPEQHLIDTSGLRLVRAGDAVASELRAAVDGRPVYVHLDVDVLEAGLSPTDFAVPGGLSWRNLREACAVLAECDVVGVEIAELERRGAPGEDESRTRLVEAIAPLLERTR